jgi:NAD(P)-dependent dehydrogenase (short-subunit alcohol dehydrogenase family)
MTTRALVTGAGSGIGAATALRLARAGAAVACMDVDPDGLAETVGRIVGAGGHPISLHADVTDLAGVEAAVAAAVAELGGLDGVANVAGTGDFTGDVTETSPEVWRRVLDINLTGTYHVSRSAIPHLQSAGGGSIANVGSQFALVGSLASPAYCASKAGVIGLTRAMAVDHAGDAIRVNCVCPGPVDTPMLAGTSKTPQFAAREQARTQGRSLIGRPGRPDEIAATIAFVMSNEAGSMTGSVITVDGGWTAG